MPNPLGNHKFLRRFWPFSGKGAESIANEERKTVAKLLAKSVQYSQRVLYTSFYKETKLGNTTECIVPNVQGKKQRNTNIRTPKSKNDNYLESMSVL